MAIGQVKNQAREHWFSWVRSENLLLLKLTHTTVLRSAAKRLWNRLRSRPSVSNIRRICSCSFGRLTPTSRDFGLDRGTPVDRYYIEHALASCAADIHGRVLEIKDDTYTRRFGGHRVTQADVLDMDRNNPAATIVADLTDAKQVPADAFDAVVLTQTLHIIYDVYGAVTTIHRILKRGGVVLATLPGISQICRDRMNNWQDHWRFTGESARRMFEGVFKGGRVEVSIYGNLCAAMNFLDGRVVEEIHPSKLDFRDEDYQVVIFVRAVKAAIPLFEGSPNSIRPQIS
jgi:SAM-dependent methyltransferase